MKIQAWPLTISLFIGALIVGVIAFAVFALRTGVDLVAPDYYDQEVRYQQHIDNIQRARQFTNGPILQVQGRLATIAIPNAAGATGTLRLYRPSDSRLDQRSPLSLDQAGRQALDLSHLLAGAWRLQLTWTVSNETYAVESWATLD